MNLTLNHDDELLIGGAMLFIDHGLVIVEDPQSSYLHDWDPSGEYVSVGPDSLYLSVQPSVDGPVKMGIFNSDSGHDDGVVYFDGEITVSSGVIVVHDANDVLRFTVRKPKGPVGIRVLVDEGGLATKMKILFLS
ncbi:hypothetical protein V1227_24420 [Lentzea sp. DG1S-22]|uniref:hypothetical protein n=1 Tax=Lentzea sp. DG1S-22 TaxID=3108822 RepID=UPI002E75FBEB|nr:hypothetical protein [Lentzea sp. DG1S-22]WVH78226.1 hypothetical protein V1227_24420 [Lentzea sp. DG1S-22]